MEVVTGPIGNGIQGIVTENPYAGVLFGALLVAVFYFVVENRTLRKEVKRLTDLRFSDKEKQVEEAKNDLEVFSKLADRLSPQDRRHRE